MYKLTYETISISVGGLYITLTTFGAAKFIGRYKINNAINTNLRSSWERRCGNMIFSDILAEDVN